MTALGLMAGVAWQLCRTAIVDIPTAILAAVVAFLLFRFKVNSAWLVLGGGLVGLASLYRSRCDRRRKYVAGFSLDYRSPDETNASD